MDAVGGVAALARALGIAQPSVSGWRRVPAERVLSVEAATGINREHLRPDLYGAGIRVTDRLQSDDLDPIERARALEYMLLASLLAKPVTAEHLALVCKIQGDASPLGMAHIRLADAASKTSLKEAGEEYFKLFVGVGRGELVPFGSFYQTGFLHERPLHKVREDFGRLGITRREGVYEPEDGIATLLESMSGLIAGAFDADPAEADAFFVRHLKPWAGRFFADLERVAKPGGLYAALGGLGQVWIAVEMTAMELPG